jgi:hypothetical protein
LEAYAADDQRKEPVRMVRMAFIECALLLSCCWMRGVRSEEEAMAAMRLGVPARGPPGTGRALPLLHFAQDRGSRLPRCALEE